MAENRTSVGRAVTLLVASGAAIVGLVLLVICFVGIGVTTLNASKDATEPCLQAYAQDDATIRYGAFPPEAVCTWDVDGVATDVVVASAPPALVAAGTALTVGGVLVCVGVLVAPRLRR